ncbi:PqqD family peptide modification chaperone [Geminocystis sp. GBBB08]|uniref:PqqD family peptide modification chaperone n=1 Tax=Geminocystis sp. GBBB08 TaxID=2604140 RepID=UPI0027E39455|nr:PqqD family peptide modification chaperone [Geminocystis sp. GBBB08]MBL1211029.1 PqqD family protein [Geminocystis sp. GBBB08]
MLQNYFKVNTSKVVQETIDGEVVIVNLKKGYYYNLIDTGAEIWSYIEKGISQEEINSIIIQKYSGNEDDISSQINDFFQELLTEQIIIPDLNPHNISEKNTIIKEDINTDKFSFQTPKLNKYTDMEELLALDPIHEVDEMGWPNAKIDTLI